jgi:hypothetical protein
MEMDTFTEAYIEAMLWADCGPDSEFQDEAGVSDIADETMTKIETDCREFQSAYSKLLGKAAETGYHLDQAGHDFWLTRNGHGAGFWDRGLGKLGDELTKAAKSFGGVDPYKGDYGKLYL